MYSWLRHCVPLLVAAGMVFACLAAAMAADAGDDSLYTRSETVEAEAAAGVYLVLINANNRFSASDAEMMAHIRRLYLGPQGTWPDAGAAVPFGRPSNSPAGEALRRLVLGMSEDELEAHWHRLKQATGAAPPRVFANRRELVRAIARTGGAFGVIEDGEAPLLPAGVRVLFRFSLRELPGGGTVSIERLFWQSIEDAADTAGVVAYLGAFPGGAFAEPARRRLDALTGAPPNPLPTPKGENPVIASRRLPASDGVWAGKVSVCADSGDVEIQVENGRFVYEGPSIASVTHFQGRIDEITGEITGYVTQGKFEMYYFPGERALHGRVRGNKLSAKGRTASCDVVIILTRVGPLPGPVASAREPKVAPAQRPDDELKDAIIAFFNGRTSGTPGANGDTVYMASDARMTSIETVEVVDDSNGLIRLDVRYRWDSGSQLVSRVGRGVATIDPSGASYTVVDFQIR